MRIDTSVSYTYPTQKTHTLSAPQTKNHKIEQPDFTNMTRQEMREWINSQIRSGEMTLEESSPFVAMTIKISEKTGIEISAENDFAKQDFIQKARDGFYSALSINNEITAKKLALALSKMLNQKI